MEESIIGTTKVCASVGRLSKIKAGISGYQDGS
jgi:hypothetical protein